MLYRSKPGFKGEDKVALSVHTYEGASYSITIDVKVE